MTPTEQADRLLADVRCAGDDPARQWLWRQDVIAAIARHLAPGDDWDAQDAAWCERVAAITADNATLRDRLARMEGAAKRVLDAPFDTMEEHDAVTDLRAALTDGGSNG